jgi:hypothetical protein
MLCFRFLKLLTLVMWAGPAMAAELVLFPTKDNTLYENASGQLSNGVGAGMFAGDTGGGGRRRGLVEFDLTALPAGAQIIGATLTLTVTRSAPGAGDVALHRSLAEWGEGLSDAGPQRDGLGATARTGDATWIHTFYTGQMWAQPGGDFVAQASASTFIASVGVYTWQGAGLVEDLRLWQSAPANNAGWFLIGDESGNGTAKRFATKDTSSAEDRPRLTVIYEVVPEPGSVAMGAMGLAVMVGRRRRRGSGF